MEHGGACPGLDVGVPTVSRIVLTHAIAPLVLLVGLAAPGAAQTADDVFDPHVLHTLHVTIHSQDWDDLKANPASHDHYPADVTWNGIRARNVGVRSRGSGSRLGTKPSLEVRFDRYATRQRFLGLRSLVVDNLATDPSMLRERLALAFLARLGLPAPRTSHVRVFVNGEYAGLGALVEPIDSVFLSRTFGTAGTLFEFHWTAPFYATFPGDELDVYRTLFEPRDAAGRSTFDLYEPVRELFRTINEAPDATFSTEVEAVMDLDLFIRFMAADAVLAEWDGFLGYDGMNNVYLHRLGNHTQFLLWDKDQTFHAADYPVLAGAEENSLMRRILADATLRARFVAALETSAQAAASNGWLATEIEQAYAQVRAAAWADTTKPFSNEAFEAEIALLRSFARTRPAFVLNEARRLRVR
jgi:spore coat protein H